MIQNGPKWLQHGPKLPKDNKKIFDCDVRLALLNSSGKPEKFSVDFIYNIEKFFKFSQNKNLE